MLTAPATASSPRRARGFTMVELMVSLLVLAILSALALPAFQGTLANYRLRSAAEGVLSGLQLARQEAVRRNTPTRFTLQQAGGWSVEYLDSSNTYVTLQSRADGETPGVTATETNDQTQVSFAATGLVRDPSSAHLSQITLSSPRASAGDLQIDLLPGGRPRLCQPNLSTTDDPRRC